MFKLDCWENETVIDQNKIYGPVKIMVPARFDFIGGWTDTPPYHFENDAAVLNTTLMFTGDDEKKQSDKAIRIIINPADRLSVTENNKAVECPGNHLILSKTLEFLGLDEPEISLSITNSIPVGSGLGGSSILVASLLAALWDYYKGKDYIVKHLNKLINNVLFIEQIMESGGGWQDQIGGLFPGIKLIETTPERRCNYSISYLENPCGQLNSNSLIIDTRIQRKASRILYSIRQKYIDRDRKTIETLKIIAANARLGFKMLQEGKLKDFAGLLSESWQMVNKIEYGSVESVRVFNKICGSDLTGLKLGGAGGGGFILTIFKDEEKKEYYKRIIKKHFPECLIYQPFFGGDGMSVFQDRQSHNIKKTNFV